jgi:dolichol-phosphate mannosyltransferase
MLNVDDPDSHQGYRTFPALESTRTAIAGATPTVSIVTPCYNESGNLPTLKNRIAAAMSEAGLSWEWIAVDDHSSDTTWSVLESLVAESDCVRAIRLSKNHGSHMAIACGLDFVRGDCTVIMASDLQDPPEAMAALVRKWQEGSRIVWAVSRKRERPSLTYRLLSKLFYALISRLDAIRRFPPSGADFVLIDRAVVRALCECSERNISLFPLIGWTGFEQDQVEFEKEARGTGTSGWTLVKRINIALDTLFAFTHFPVRAMSALGLGCATLGFLYAILIIFNAFLGDPIIGWSSLIVVVLMASGVIMMMLGVLGEYLWRALDESRARPRYIVERSAGPSAASIAETSTAQSATHG